MINDQWLIVNKLYNYKGEWFICPFLVCNYILCGIFLIIVIIWLLTCYILFIGKLSLVLRDEEQGGDN